MSTPGSSPSPALIWVIRCFGVAPLVPNATMWLAMADAPALVPATTAPCAVAIDDRAPEQRAADDARQAQLVATGHEDRRRVVTMPTSRLSLASSRTSGRMPRTSPIPIWRKRDRYSSVASSPRDEAVEMTTTRASGAAGER